MASYRWWGHPSQNKEEDESGTYAVHTLNDEETIAKLAAGVRRFNLPDEHNYIKIFKRLALTKGPYQTQSLQSLAGIYENRRLYVKAANYWQWVSDLPNQSKHTYKQAREKLSQIKDNWGQFEPVMTQPHGKGATVEFRFRNAKQVDFAAFRINIPELLNDVKAYIKRRPNKLKWQKINVDNIGRRLVENNEKKYIGKKAADWSMPLSPRKGHWDRRVTVQTPLKKAGAYLLVATLPGGHLPRSALHRQRPSRRNAPFFRHTRKRANLRRLSRGHVSRPDAWAHVLRKPNGRGPGAGSLVDLPRRRRARQPPPCPGR